MFIVPAPHPKEFRDDVVAIARRGEAPIAQIAKDFGISESCLRNWLLEQENEVLRRAAAYLSQANLRLGQSPK
jgi:transposase